jgi:hypothetical protein
MNEDDYDIGDMQGHCNICDEPVCIFAIVSHNCRDEWWYK